MSSWLPRNHPLVTDALIPYARSIEAVTEGRVKVKVLPKSVGSPVQQYEVAATGQADIVYGCHAYTPGRFKIFGFSELPYGGDDAIATSVAYWRVYEKALQTNNEMADVKLLSVFTHGPGNLFTRDHTITGLSGNEGLKIRGGGISSTRVIDTLGMTSVQAPISKAAEMLSNRIVNGITLEPSGLTYFKLEKYANNRFTVPGGLYNASFFVAMNPDKWNKISAKDRAAIEAISGEALARQAGEAWKRITEQAYEEFEKRDFVSTIPDGTFADQLNTAFMGYEREWIASLEGTNLNGADLLAEYRAEVRALVAE